MPALFVFPECALTLTHWRHNLDQHIFCVHQVKVTFEINKKRLIFIAIAILTHPIITTVISDINKHVKH